MTRLHPDDVKAIAREIVVELRRPVLVPGAVPSAGLSAVELEARLRSEGLQHRRQRKAAKH